LTMKVVRRFSVAMLLSAAMWFGLAGSGGAQSPQSTPNDLTEKITQSENRWRLTVVDPKAQVDTVAPNVRSARNEYWKPILQEIRDAEKIGRSWTLSGGGFVWEIPSLPNDIWVVATFDHFHVIPIDPDFKLFYTEMSFTIREVVNQPASSSLAAGGLFDVDEQGGRIKKSDGSVEMWLVSPKDYFVQPGHTYLMLIHARDEGNLYTIHEQWDVSTGIAVPDSGNLCFSDSSPGCPSKISGKATQDAIASLRAALQQMQNH